MALRTHLLRLGHVNTVEDGTHSNALVEFVNAGPLALAEVAIPSPIVAKVVAEENLNERIKELPVQHSKDAIHTGTQIQTHHCRLPCLNSHYSLSLNHFDVSLSMLV